jgi:hypothetical protein
MSPFRSFRVRAEANGDAAEVGAKISRRWSTWIWRGCASGAMALGLLQTNGLLPTRTAVETTATAPAAGTAMASEQDPETECVERVIQQLQARGLVYRASRRPTSKRGQAAIPDDARVKLPAHRPGEGRQ